MMKETKTTIFGPTNPEIKPGSIQRFASTIGLYSEYEQRYRELHANAWPSVVSRLKEANIQNYSIYITEIEGKKYLFSYFEYVGSDLGKDMSKLTNDSDVKKWWQETDPCQFILQGVQKGERWKALEQVFHLD